MPNRPKTLPKAYGWCRKKHHGPICHKQDGCPICKVEAERKAKGLCCAKLAHGPGHQSITYCEAQGEHKVHSCRIMNRKASWKGRGNSITCTGFFDEYPFVDS